MRSPTGDTYAVKSSGPSTEPSVARRTATASWRMNADLVSCVGEVRVQPGDGSAANTEVGLEPLRQHVMGNCIKRCQYVKTGQYGGLLVVSGGVYTVHDMQLRSLGGMASAVR